MGLSRPFPLFFGCTRGEIFEKGRKGNLALDMAVYLTRDSTREREEGLDDYFDTLFQGFLSQKTRKTLSN
jgi:hypothetical protein